MELDSQMIVDAQSNTQSVSASLWATTAGFSSGAAVSSLLCAHSSSRQPAVQLVVCADIEIDVCPNV